MTTLHRSETDKILGGVCGGIAETYDIDPTLVRLAAVALVFWGISPLIYIIAWLIVPTESDVYETKEVETEKTDTDEETESEE